MEQAYGTIWAVFGHRLAIEGAEGKVLADLGPKGLEGLRSEGLALRAGDAVTVTGTAKPGEIKVATLVPPDGRTRAIAWPEKHGKDHGPADPAIALTALREAGYRVEGEPRRRPKHVEVRATRDGAAFEIHVALDGTIRKAKPAEAALAG